MDKEDGVIAIKFYAMQKQIDALQQENKEQEEYIKYWQNEYDKKMEIIDKAIEYIEFNDESLYTFEPDYDYEEELVDNYEPSNYREDLLEILKKEDK